MSDDKDLHTEADAIREETAATAPELGEHDLIGDLQKKLEEANSKALYAAAELQNARRRMDKEVADTRAYAVANFARDILSVRDHLDRALLHVPTTDMAEGKAKSFVEGIQSTLRELDAVLARNGVTKIEAIGQQLDPNKHQAMMEIPTNNAAPGTIVEEMQSGYTIKDRLLRPALVGVARNA
nr:nucleotide exchange factor GrpE [uncultured Sphingomonas sp.]